MERLDARIRHLWIGSSVVTGVVVGSLAGILTYVTGEIVWPAVPVIVLLVVLGVVYSHYRYRNWLFEVHDDHLELEYGVVWKVSVVVPYVRVQHIDTNRGPVERLLGLATLRVYTAGSEGADLGIPGLTRTRAERMQAELKERAIESDQGADGV